MCISIDGMASTKKVLCDTYNDIDQLVGNDGLTLSFNTSKEVSKGIKGAELA